MISKNFLRKCSWYFIKWKRRIDEQTPCFFKSRYISTCKKIMDVQKNVHSDYLWMKNRTVFPLFILFLKFSIQLLSCVRLCHPMDCSRPGFPVHHQPLELTQTHVHRVSDGQFFFSTFRWRVLTMCGPLEKGMANHFSILALRTPWTVWKGKKIGYRKMNSPGQ